MLLKKVSKLFVVLSLALSFGLSMLSLSPVASVSGHASYGGEVPCDEFKTPSKRLKCLNDLKVKADKATEMALDKKMYEKYNDLLSEANNLYWEIWNITTYGFDYF